MRRERQVMGEMLRYLPYANLICRGGAAKVSAKPKSAKIP